MSCLSSLQLRKEAGMLSRTQLITMAHPYQATLAQSGHEFRLWNRAFDVTLALMMVVSVV